MTSCSSYLLLHICLLWFPLIQVPPPLARAPHTCFSLQFVIRRSFSSLPPLDPLTRRSPPSSSPSSLYSRSKVLSRLLWFSRSLSRSLSPSLSPCPSRPHPSPSHIPLPPLSSLLFSLFCLFSSRFPQWILSLKLFSPLYLLAHSHHIFYFVE